MENKPLSGKRIILIASRAYYLQIEEEIKSLGATCITITDKPNDGFWDKVLGRLKFKPYINGPLCSHYEKKIDAIDGDIDYVLSVRGEYTPISVLDKLRNKFPNAKLVLYMWDSIINNKGIEKKWDSYDEVWTFDRKDYLQYKDRLKFLPLYYCEKVLPEDYEKAEKKYDIAFIGTGHEDRVSIIKAVDEQCREKGLKFYYYIYMPHIFVFYYNKLFNPYFSHVKKKDVQFGFLPLSEVYRIYSEASCVLDVESSTQTGLTMRTIEILGLKKKLMTTNKDVVNYDFYDDNNVCIFDRNNGKVDVSFFDREYHELSEKIYNKYSLREWVLTLLNQ
ncbi:MAG: hypothetical protein MJ107_01060 [Lachnospiraceae bacterium]|nr:hypothetical protein [Lachnospiraceae bacterium]